MAETLDLNANNAFFILFNSLSCLKYIIQVTRRVQ